MFINIGAGEKVLATALLDDFVETRLVDWKLVAVPSVDTWYRDANDSYLNVGTFKSNDCHGWSTDITGSYATYIFTIFLHIILKYYKVIIRPKKNHKNKFHLLSHALEKKTINLKVNLFTMTGENFVPILDYLRTS